MPQVKPSDFSLLLEVFRDGLQTGLVTREAIVKWADHLIEEKDEPDYFFIEVSLCGNTDNLFTILDKHIILPKSIVGARVILGLAWYNLNKDPLEIEKVLNAIDRYQCHERLTPYESASIYGLDYYDRHFSPVDVTLLIEDTLEFLSIYKDFNLSNHDQWLNINKRVEETLIEEQEKLKDSNEAYKITNQKKIRIKRQKLYTLIGALSVFSLCIIIIDYKAFQNGSFTSKFNSDLSQMCIFYLAIFVPCFVLGHVYTLWKKVRT